MESGFMDMYRRLCSAALQIEAANKVIQYYATGKVKDKQEDEDGELVDYEYPAANDTAPALEYLKKYGVKNER